MKKLTVIIVLILIFGLSSCYYTVEEIKEMAPKYFEESGMKIIAFKGWRRFLAGGGTVSYLIKELDGDIMYNYTLASYGHNKELHLLGITPVDPE